MNRSLTNCGSLRRIAGWMFSTVAILIVGSSLVAFGADGVPNAVKKLDKTHKQLSTIRLRAIEPGATLQDFCVDRDSKAGAPVFNRTVSLKDTWAKAKGAE